jgi:hypothetical protein
MSRLVMTISYLNGWVDKLVGCMMMLTSAVASFFKHQIIEGFLKRAD